jgi:hypothetical protein
VANGVFDGFEERVFSNPLCASENKRVVDLVVWTLNSVGEPVNYVLCLIGIDIPKVMQPLGCLSRIAIQDYRRSIQIKYRGASVLDPPALEDKLVVDDHGQTWCPYHLFDRFILVEPRRWGEGLWLACLRVHDRVAACIGYLNVW